MRKIKIYILPGTEHLYDIYAPMADASHRSDFFNLQGEGKQFWESVGLDQCDFIVHWMCLFHRTTAERDDYDRFAQELSRSSDKPILLFSPCDGSATLDFPCAIKFRSSCQESNRETNEYVYVPPVIDPKQLLKLDELPVREKKGSKPTIGFCGNIKEVRYGSNAWRRFWKWAGYSIVGMPKLYRIFQKIGIHLSKEQGRIVRTQATACLQRSKRVQCNFIERLGGICHPSFDDQKQANMRRAFWDNLLESDYALCARGNGNFSYRFFEALACGRIPIFVNTDCGLPFSDVINYKDYVIWVEQDQIEHIADIVADFHANITPQEFIDRQRACRKLWEDYLSVDAFSKRIAQQIQRAGFPQK